MYQNYYYCYYYYHVNKTALLDTKSKAILLNKFNFDSPVKSHPVSPFLFFPTSRSPKRSLFLQMTFPFLQLKWHPNLWSPTVLSLHKAVCPSLAAVTHVPRATAASSMQSASAGGKPCYVRRKHREHQPQNGDTKINLNIHYRPIKTNATHTATIVFWLLIQHTDCHTIWMRQ